MGRWILCPILGEAHVMVVGRCLGWKGGLIARGGLDVRSYLRRCGAWPLFGWCACGKLNFDDRVWLGQKWSMLWLLKAKVEEYFERWW